MTEHYGIDLDGLMPSLAAADGARGRCTSSYQGDVPPAIALGDLPGHAPTLDSELPIDSRGSGLDLQAVADGATSGRTQRLPIAYAWELLHAMHEDAPTPTWSWPQHQDSTDSMQPGRAIAVAVRDLCRGDGREEPGPGSNRSSKTLVVPDFYQEHQQEHLLRALRIEAGSARLLWRPVAAALTWLQDRGASLAHEAEHLRSIGRLLHLHLGTDCWEATVLELVQFVDEQRTPWVLPGRRLRAGETATPLRAWPNRWLEECCEAITPRASNAAGSQAWNLLWASPWARALILSGDARERARAQLPPWIDPDLVESGRQKLAPMLFAMSGAKGRSRGSRMARELDLEQLPALEPGDWLNNLQTELSSTELMGAVVTGPFASLPLEGSRPLGEQLVANLAQLDDQKVLVEGADPTATGICARGAATFGARSAKGQPTYLDTLPSVSMIAIEHGEPEWINLLETDEPWVMGSQVWSKEPDKLRFSIQKGERELKVVVHRGGSPTCRSVVTEFEAPASDSSPVSLHVSITPGQGAPRVEIRPDDRDVLQGKSLTLDWTTAHDTGLSPEEELESIDRICPPHEPRVASHEKWRWRNHLNEGVVGIRRLIQLHAEGAARSRRAQRPASVSLERLRSVLKDWDKNKNLGWCTAVSSDCTLEVATGENQAILDAFVERLDRQLGATKSQTVRKDTLRVLAAISAYSPNLRDELSLFLEGRSFGDHSSKMAVWFAAGHCLRQPNHCRRVFEMALEENTSLARKQSARLLMFRHDALSTTPPELASELLHAACRSARRYTRMQAFRQDFQEAALLAAYLLRMRIYDPTFAAPGSEDYDVMEHIFEDALRTMQQTHVQGGVIDKTQLVKDILAYLRSKGRGRLVVYAQDD